MLNSNCATTMLLMIFFAVLLDKSQTPSKTTYLWNVFRTIAVEAASQAYATTPYGLRIDVHGTAGNHILLLQPNGMVLGVQAFLSSIHASLVSSWHKIWDEMNRESILSGPWQQEDELLLLDVLAFLLHSPKFRRSKQLPPWRNRGLQAVRQLRTTLFQLLHGAMAHSISEHLQANNAFERPVPSRRLSGRRRLVRPVALCLN